MIGNLCGKENPDNPDEHINTSWSTNCNKKFADSDEIKKYNEEWGKE